jgi:hypothetical protein
MKALNVNSKLSVNKSLISKFNNEKNFIATISGGSYNATISGGSYL